MLKPGKYAPQVGRDQSRLVGLYFILTYLVSWTGAFVLALPYLLRHESVPQMTGLLMFPVMLLGPSLVGLVFTWSVDGLAGLCALARRIGRLALPFKWYATLLMPPCVITAVLLSLKVLVSPVFTPNTFLVGLSFGLAAGFLEELGWTGFALPRMLAVTTPLKAGILLGVIWGLWHLPVIDFLGAASPHGIYLPRFMVAFIAAMTAIRVIMTFVYSRVQSVALAQLMHAVSTGSLVALGPSAVTASQEATWYSVYAAALWVIVAFIAFVQRGSSKSRGV